MSKGIGGHQSASMRTDEWLTPREIFTALGPFDLDPCSPINRPWDTAAKHYTIEDNGLILPWQGRVWLNPPYGREVEKWLRKMSLHSDGISLIFGRTDTAFFHEYIFNTADSLLFLKGRLYFYTSAGTRAKHNCGAPVVLASYGEKNIDALAESGIEGKHLLLNSTPIIIVGVSPSWKSVIKTAIIRNGGKSDLKTIYDLIETIAPDKVKSNNHFREKIRQQLQVHFIRIGKGIYSAN